MDSRSPGLFERLEHVASELPAKSIAISGSTMVQVLLGKQWERSDIDIYSSTLAAPRVRRAYASLNILLVNTGLDWYVFQLTCFDCAVTLICYYLNYL